MKKRLLFVITQFYKGGAEVALLNLIRNLSPQDYEIDFLIFDQIDLPNAHSLIKDIPGWVNVCNAAAKEGRLAVFNKVINKIWFKITKRQRYRKASFNFVRNKQYDFAFSIGEWMSPEFVAKRVSAKRKAVWIHTDIDKAPYFCSEVFQKYDKLIDKYIFVSKRSRESAEGKYDFIKKKSYVINNIVDDNQIITQSADHVESKYVNSAYTIVTVANLREEKNYPRQIEVMSLLKRVGLDIKWINIGSTANIFIYNKLKALIQNYGLEDDFIIVGADQNPYRYMAKADFVAVLSDFESWSMVITEAKVLGIPVVATKTSGALEQIVHQETGILCEFNAENIVCEILKVLNDKTVYSHMKENLKGYNSVNNALNKFSRLMEL